MKLVCYHLDRESWESMARKPKVGRIVRFYGSDRLLIYRERPSKRLAAIADRVSTV